MRASSGISSPRSAARVAPCRSSARRARGSPRAVSAGKPICRTISAPRSQRIWMSSRVTSGVRAMAREVPQPLRERAAGRARRAHVAERDPQRVVPVDDLHARASSPWSSRAEQRREARRVARAAGVLQQQRVVQRRALDAVEPELLGEAAADDARAHGVARRLPLGEVERRRQGGEDLGEAAPRRAERTWRAVGWCGVGGASPESLGRRARWLNARPARRVPALASRAAPPDVGPTPPPPPHDAPTDHRPPRRRPRVCGHRLLGQGPPRHGRVLRR